MRQGLVVQAAGDRDLRFARLIGADGAVGANGQVRGRVVVVRGDAQRQQLRGLFRHAGGRQVLGLVLGQMCESNFRRAYTLTNGSLVQIFTKPITAVIMTACVIMLLYPFVKPFITKKKEA